MISCRGLSFKDHRLRGGRKWKIRVIIRSFLRKKNKVSGSSGIHHLHNSLSLTSKWNKTVSSNSYKICFLKGKSHKIRSTTY
jgi:hypothetical protein